MGKFDEFTANLIIAKPSVDVLEESLKELKATNKNVCDLVDILKKIDVSEVKVDIKSIASNTNKNDLSEKINRARYMGLKPSIILCTDDAEKIKSTSEWFIHSALQSKLYNTQAGHDIDTYLGCNVYLDKNLKESKVVVDFN